MLLELIDGGIVNITSDTDFIPGNCSTCDFGASYVNQFTLSLKTREIHIEAEGNYEYPLSEGHMMKVILPNVDKIKTMTEDEFTKWIEIEIKNLVCGIEFTVKIRQ